MSSHALLTVFSDELTGDNGVISSCLGGEMGNRILQWATEMPVSLIEPFWLRSIDKDQYKPTDDVSWEDFWQYERLTWECERRDALANGFVNEEEATTLKEIFQNPTAASIQERFTAYRCLWIIYYLNRKHIMGYKTLDEAWNDPQQLTKWREKISYSNDGMSW